MTSQQPPERDELVEYRLAKLEQQYAEVKNDIKGIMEAINRLEKRFAFIPDGGLNCQVHTQFMTEMRKQVDNHQTIIDDLQSFKWRAVGIIGVIMLVMQIFGTTLAEKLFRRDAASAPPVKIELVMPTGAVSGGIVTNGIQEVRGNER